MIKLLAFLIFIFSIAFTAGGIILTSRLRNRLKTELFSSLLYLQVFIYTFGFYGIWGQVLIRSFLSTYISEDLMGKFSDLAMLLGLPFLVFAWLMLLRFASGLSGRNNKSWMLPAFLIMNFSVLVILGFVISGEKTIKPAVLIRNYYITANMVYSFVASYLIHFPWKGRSFIGESDRRIIAPVIFLLMTIQTLLLLFYPSRDWLALIFIFCFFAGDTFLPVYFSYFTILPASAAAREKSISFGQFCSDYEISPRESDIITEICNGLSNQEISDKLFISLQTVKDHTHRIYIKTNVRSRVQLITLVKEMKVL